MKKHGSSLRQNEPTRRDFVRRAAYVAPLILTLPAAPAFAQVGSGSQTCPDPDFSFPVFDPETGTFLGCGS